MTVKEIQAGYLVISYFKDIYLYLAQNNLPSNKTAIKKVEPLAEKYILLDSLSFKIVSNPHQRSHSISYTSSIYSQSNHCILFNFICRTSESNQDIFNDKQLIFIPNLIHNLHLYIKGCNICQLPCNEKPPTRQLQTRFNLNYRPLSKLSMDLKVMPRSHKGHKYILCIIDEVTNYLFMVPT